MSRVIFLVRFFHVVSPVPPLTVVGFIVVVAIAGIALIVDADSAAMVLMPVVLLQTLTVSSGFAGAARRGHYDLPFTTGRSRVAIAIVHWAMSVLPGVAAWLTVAAIESVVRRDLAGASLSSGTSVAMCLVSTVPWALTVRLPALTGGIGWVLLLVMTTSVLPETRREAAGLAVLVCPWILVGRDLGVADAIPVAAALLAASAAMGAAVAWIERADIPLETAQ